jgi:hypothetical protein
MKVLVCGGRDIADEGLVFNTLDKVSSSVSLTMGQNISLLIHGGARGADSIAEKWAQNRGVETRRYPADWGRYGRQAGPIRNREMLMDGKPDLVVAFPGGKGTHNMESQAERMNLPIIRIGNNWEVGLIRNWEHSP